MLGVLLLEYEDLYGLDWAWLSADGAMTKAPLGGEKTGENPTHRGQSGTKRHVLSEGQGIPINVVVTGANVHDVHLLEKMLETQWVTKPDTVERRSHLCLDADYISPDSEPIIRQQDMIPHIRPRKQETQEKQTGKKPRRLQMMGC